MGWPIISPPNSIIPASDGREVILSQIPYPDFNWEGFKPHREVHPGCINGNDSLQSALEILKGAANSQSVYASQLGLTDERLRLMAASLTVAGLVEKWWGLTVSQWRKRPDETKLGELLSVFGVKNQGERDILTAKKVLQLLETLLYDY